MSGRINRAKYFYLVMITNIVYYVLIFIMSDALSTAHVRFIIDEISGFIFLISLILIFIIQACLIIKRLHDLERNGSHFWLLLIPFYNVYLSIVLFFKRGTVGLNKYGADPIPTN